MLLGVEECHLVLPLISKYSSSMTVVQEWHSLGFRAVKWNFDHWNYLINCM
jgi:hypothetical protein